MVMGQAHPAMLWRTNLDGKQMHWLDVGCLWSMRLRH